MASEQEPASNAPSRRTFVKLALGLGGAAAVAGFVGPALAARLLAEGNGGGGTGPSARPCPEFADLQGIIQFGGPPKDGIPAIDNPRFMSADAADGFLRPTDIVFGLDRAGVQRAYPQRILVWHEIVNDRIDGQRIPITYCPLTGSQIAFIPPTPSDTETFGTSGSLVNSNLLMYDRASDSRWPQILGTAINGQRCANVLAEVPLVWTTWDRWKSRHPDTEVMTTETGFFRDYNFDPYRARGYYTDGSLWFPVLHRSDRFHPKKTFLGVNLEGRQLAIPLEEFRSVAVQNSALAGVPLVALYDEGLDTIRLFRREVEDTTLTFQRVNGKIVDDQAGSVWSHEGVGQEGSFEGVSLSQVNAINVMWFAWYAFYPRTQVLS